MHPGTCRRDCAAPLPGAWGRAPSVRNARQGNGGSSPALGQDVEEYGTHLPGKQLCGSTTPGLCILPQLGLDQELVSLTLIEKVSHTPVRKHWEDKI